MSDTEFDKKDDGKERRHGSSGSGKSPTRFMERPGTKKKGDPENQEESSFSNDDLDALENQEGDEGQVSAPNPGGKGDSKPDPRKFQDPQRKDSSSDDTDDCACP